MQNLSLEDAKKLAIGIEKVSAKRDGALSWHIKSKTYIGPYLTPRSQFSWFEDEHVLQITSSHFLINVFLKKEKE